jgi:Tol biopolymer transport system component
VGTGQSRRLSPGDLTNLRPSLAWFPDGKHLLLIGAPEGQPLRTYVMDIEGGKTQALGPAGFFGIAVAGDGKRIAGRNAAEEAVVFDRETEKVQAILGIARQELIQRWTDDGRALIVYSATAWEAHIYRVDVATGKRTLLQNIELSEKAGSRLPIRLAYAERSKTYAYSAVRDLGILYVVEGLQ